MLTVPQAAIRANKNPETIRRWIRAGKLRSRKFGTQHLIAEDELEDLLAADIHDLPAWLGRTSTGEPMPDVVAVIRRSRLGR